MKLHIQDQTSQAVYIISEASTWLKDTGRMVVSLKPTSPSLLLYCGGSEKNFDDEETEQLKTQFAGLTNLLSLLFYW